MNTFAVADTRHRSNSSDKTIFRTGGIYAIDARVCGRVRGGLDGGGGERQGCYLK